MGKLNAVTSFPVLGIKATGRTEVCEYLGEGVPIQMLKLVLVHPFILTYVERNFGQKYQITVKKNRLLMVYGSIIYRPVL